MKNFLSLILCFVLLTSIAPQVICAEEKSAGEQLYAMGLVKGDENGNLLEANNLKREDAILLLLRMLGEDTKANNYLGDCSFIDVDEDSYYYSFLAYAEDKGLTNGIGNDKFGMARFVSEKEMLAFILRALEYQDTAWQDIIYQADEIGLTDGFVVEEDASAIRAKIFEYMLSALDIEIKGTDIKLAEELGLEVSNNSDDEADEADETDDEDEDSTVAGRFKVKSIDIYSLKSLDIVFSDTINTYDVNDEHIVIKNCKYKLYLQDDRKTVRLVFDLSQPNQETYTIHIKNIKSEAGEEIADYQEDILLEDNTKPVLKKAKFLDKRTLSLKFSEPVNFYISDYKSSPSIQIDGSNPVLKLTKSADARELTIDFKSSLSLGEHQLLVSGIRDYAGNQIEDSLLDLKLKEDKEEPAATKAIFVDSSTLLVYFDEPIYKKGKFKINGDYASSSEYYMAMKHVIKLNFDYKLNLATIEDEDLKYKGQADRSGNKVEDWEAIDFDVIGNDEYPEVEISMDSSNKLVLNFSKPMHKDYGKVLLLDYDTGDTLVTKNAPFSFKKDSNDTLLMIDFKYQSLLEKHGQKFNVRLEGFKDASFNENELDDIEEEIFAKDNDLPKLVYSSGNKAVQLTEDEDDAELDSITLHFTEPINVEDLEDLSNYAVSDVDFGNFAGIEGAEIEDIYDDDKTVVIKLPHARDIKKTSRFTIKNLRDKSGNMMKPVNDAKIIRSDYFTLNGVVASKSDELILTYSQALDDFDEAAYEVRNKAGEVISIVDYEVDKTDNEEVKVILASNMTSDITDYMLVPTESAEDLQSIFGIELSKPRIFPIVDLIKPSVAELSSTGGKILLNFSEEVFFKAGEARSLEKGIYIYKPDQMQFVYGKDYTIKKVAGSAEDYASQVEIVGLNAENSAGESADTSNQSTDKPKKEKTFEKGKSYKIIIINLWNKAGRVSEMYEGYVEIEGE